MKISTSFSFFKKIKTFFFLLFFLITIFNSNAQIGWTQVPTPDTSATRNLLRGISGTSSSDIWTVGYFEEPVVGNPFIIEKDLIMHWNGFDWQIYPPMNLSTTLDDLWDVESISTTDVWAVGNYNAPGISTQAELLHFNGSNWVNQPLPINPSSSYLYSLDALSATDIWAAGGQGATPTRPAYVIHYNGSSWTEVTVPPVGSYRNSFYAIDAVSPTDVWAVGHYGNMAGDFHAMAMHWDGSSWSDVSLPSNVSSAPGELLNLKVVSANDIWATGYYLAGGAITLHWDGSSWTDYIPATGGSAFAVIASDNIFSFGEYIKHWDGISWTVTDSLLQLSQPSLLNTVTFSNGEIWSCGRTIDTAGIFHSLIYRTIGDSAVFRAGANQTVTAPIVGQSNIDSLLMIDDNDVSQIVHYTVVSAPAHGNLAGFPAVAITNNGIAQPSGLTYNPQSGYSGMDQFSIQVSVGNIATQTIINLNISSTVSVNNVDYATAFNIFPNPAKDNFTLNLKWNENHACSVRITDMQGRILIMRDYLEEKEINDIVDVSNLTAGIYFVIIEGSKGKLTSKIIIE